MHLGPRGFVADVLVPHIPPLDHLILAQLWGHFHACCACPILNMQGLFKTTKGRSAPAQAQSGGVIGKGRANAS